MSWVKDCSVGDEQSEVVLHLTRPSAEAHERVVLVRDMVQIQSRAEAYASSDFYLPTRRCIPIPGCRTSGQLGPVNAKLAVQMYLSNAAVDSMSKQSHQLTRILRRRLTSSGPTKIFAEKVPADVSFKGDLPFLRNFAARS